MRKKICSSTSEGERGEQDIVGTYTGTWASDSSTFQEVLR
jgi:hypothetical protein